MNLLEEVSQIIEKIDLLHINDPTITKYWDEMAKLLIKSESDTISMLESLEDPNKVDSISSVFEEISYGLKSKEFIECILKLEKKFPELILVHMIECARQALDYE